MISKETEARHPGLLPSAPWWLSFAWVQQASLGEGAGAGCDKAALAAIDISTRHRTGYFEMEINNQPRLNPHSSWTLRIYCRKKCKSTRHSRSIA